MGERYNELAHHGVRASLGCAYGGLVNGSNSPMGASGSESEGSVSQTHSATRTYFVGGFSPLLSSQLAAISSTCETQDDVSILLMDDATRMRAPLRARLDWLQTDAGLSAQPTDAFSVVSNMSEAVDRSVDGSLIAIDAPPNVRDDPLSTMALYPPQTRAALTLRICCVGAESTGKSTLVQALAQRHRARWVGEFGRDFTIEKKANGTNDHWVTDDFIRIAQEQQRLEDEAAREAGAYLFCDTDAMSTDLWHERYLGNRTAEVDRYARARRYDLFVLCGTDIAWVADDIRLGSNTREAMHQRFVDVLTNERPEPFVHVTGTLEERMALVDTAVASLGLRVVSSVYDAVRWHDLDGRWVVKT
jgi:nicotinamide riboside kinase